MQNFPLGVILLYPNYVLLCWTEEIYWAEVGIVRNVSSCQELKPQIKNPEVGLVRIEWHGSFYLHNNTISKYYLLSLCKLLRRSQLLKWAQYFTVWVFHWLKYQKIALFKWNIRKLLFSYLLEKAPAHKNYVKVGTTWILFFHEFFWIREKWK